MKLSSYDIDFEKLITQYIRPHLRGIIRNQWLATLTLHLKVIHAKFILRFNALKSEMKWDGRTILLERYLQIKLSIPALEIVNNDLTQNPNIGYPCPNTINTMGYGANDPQSPIGNDSDSRIDVYGFTINIPSGSNYNLEEVKAIVNSFLIGSSDFEIEEI